MGEVDLIARLDAIDEEAMYQQPATTRAVIEEAMARIESLTAKVEAMEWQPIETAKKDRTPILIRLKDPLPEPERTDLDAWHGSTFVARHNGVEADGFDIGWQFAAPVGHGGFPDSWIEGWCPLPAPPRAKEEGE